MRRALALGFVLGVVALGLFAPACFDRSCDAPPAQDFGAGAGEGQLLTADTWESTPVATFTPGVDGGPPGGWLYFGPGGWITFTVPEWQEPKENRPLVEMHAYVSEQAQPSAANFAEIGGNGAEWRDAVPGKVTLVNATCAQYYVRVVLRGGRPKNSLYDAAADDAGDAGTADALSAADATD